MSLHYTLSDVAGGYSPSMLDAMRRALDLTKILGTMDQDYHSLTFEEVFRLATLGGSQGQTHASMGSAVYNLNKKNALTFLSLLSSPGSFSKS